MENIFVRGIEIVAKQTTNSKYDFYLDELPFFKTDFLQYIPLGEFLMDSNRFLGNKEGVFKCFAQQYGKFRFCIIATKEEQEQIKSLLSNFDSSIEFVEFFDDIIRIHKDNNFASIVYFPNINILNKNQETNIPEIYPNEEYLLGRYEFQIIQAVEATKEYFDNFVREQILGASS